MSVGFLPKAIAKVRVPPIKCQGIKTKLVPFISANLSWKGEGRWIEPFLGSGVVALNVSPTRAKLSDSNKHIIGFYKQVQSGKITEFSVRDRLREMGACLKEKGADYFYEIRERFNAEGDPMDLLFLNRSCFNGVMRFNGKGKYNVPFGKKTDRFRQAYVTKIVNQVSWLHHVLGGNQWEIQCLDWRAALSDAAEDDFVYVDPPYIGRHTDYFNQWKEEDACELARICHALPCGYALSMWMQNKYRENPHLAECWKGDDTRTISHFYHVGSTESLRNEMIEALVIRPGYASGEPFALGARKKREPLFEKTLFDDIL